MPRNQFKDEGEGYHCPRCTLGVHHMCNDRECVCEHIIPDIEIPAGKPEDEDLSQEIGTLVEGDPEEAPASLAELRKSDRYVTDAHIARPAT